MKKYITIFLGVILSMASTYFVFAEEAGISLEEDMMLDEVPPITAEAVISGTTEGSTLSGKAVLFERQKEGHEGVYIKVTVSNVPNPGKHGFHIHENGSCAEEGKAAGGHFNPMKVEHGFLPKDGHEHAHSGDMGNIEIDENGHGTLFLNLPGVKLEDIAGKAIILHEKEDDFGQPTGNAGGRIGCGIIG